MNHIESQENCLYKIIQGINTYKTERNTQIYNQKTQRNEFVLFGQSSGSKTVRHERRRGVQVIRTTVQRPRSGNALNLILMKYILSIL